MNFVDLLSTPVDIVFLGGLGELLFWANFFLFDEEDEEQDKNGFC